jgi:hypothetical protein
MMCNTRAMFDYHPRRMAYGPSMQLGLENLFRINMNKGDNHKDRSDFIVVRRNLDFLANMIGLSNMPVSQAQRTVETYLQIMVDNGVLSKFKPVAGTGGVEKLKRQYELISGKGYAMQRQEQREKSTVKALERFLADPLSPQRQPKQPGVDSKDKLSTPQRRRGRPKKSGT